MRSPRVCGCRPARRAAVDRRERPGHELVVPLTATITGAHEPGLGQDPQVLADCGSRDRAAGGQVDDPGRAGGHHVEQRPPYGVGQCGEHVHPQKVTVELPVVEHADARERCPRGVMLADVTPAPVPRRHASCCVSRSATPRPRSSASPSGSRPGPGWAPSTPHLQSLVKSEGLHTVCQEAGCPNIFECWEDREATFLIGGDQCTRRCDFCQIDTGKPQPLDRDDRRRHRRSRRGRPRPARARRPRRGARRPAHRRQPAARRDGAARRDPAGVAPAARPRALAALRGANCIIEGGSQRWSRRSRLRDGAGARTAPDCYRKAGESAGNPRRGRSARRPRPRTLPPLDDAVCAAQCRKRDADDATPPAPATSVANSRSSVAAGSSVRPVWLGEGWMIVEECATTQPKRSEAGSAARGPAPGSPATTSQMRLERRAHLVGVEAGRERRQARLVDLRARAAGSRAGGRRRRRRR